MRKGFSQARDATDETERTMQKGEKGQTGCICTFARGPRLTSVLEVLGELESIAIFLQVGELVDGFLAKETSRTPQSSFSSLLRLSLLILALIPNKSRWNCVKLAGSSGPRPSKAVTH